MGTLGEDLRAAREQKGLTLKQISEKTRIGLSFLKAIEDDKYADIPGEVFVTGFLRSYARELGVPEKELLERYKELRLPPPEAAPEAAPKQQYTPRLPILSEKYGRALIKRPIYLVVIGGVLLGGLLTAVLLLMTPRKEAEKARPSPAPAQARAAMTFVKATTVSRPAALPAANAQPAPAAPFEVKLSAAERSWYMYHADDGKFVRGVLQKGKELSIKADKKIVLSLGNAGGVKVEFNGRELKPYGGQGVMVKDILFTRDIPGVVQPRRVGVVLTPATTARHRR